MRLQSLDNRIRLSALEKEIAHLEQIIADLDFENRGNLAYRNTLQQTLKECCQIYSSLQDNRDLSARYRPKP